jgi:putative ABC transport system permease protein
VTTRPPPRARGRARADVEAATSVTSSIVEERWSYSSLFSVGSPVREAPGWVTYADGDLARALGLRVIAGDVPSGPHADADADGERPVAAVITRCLARRLFDDARAALGARLSCEQGRDVPIAAVVEDLSMRMALMPHHRCTAFLFGGAARDRESRLIVRARAGRRAAILADLAGAFAGRSALGYFDVRAFDSTTGAHYRIGRGLLTMLGFFGVVVALIALLGALAATSFLVAQRTRQVGIRRALGATKGDIVAYFLLESSLAAAMGSVIGVVSTGALFLLMKQVFQDVRFRPGLVALALAALWLGTIIATLIPALRAARVPPSVAGRSL